MANANLVKHTKGVWMKITGIRAVVRRSFVAVMSVALATCFLTTPASAARPYGWTLVYFSDAAHTEEVGWQYCGCIRCGEFVGTRTPYLEHQDVVACG